MEAGRGCRQCLESLVSPVLLPVPTGGTVPLRSCCLALPAFQQSSCPVALLLQLSGGTLLFSSPFKRVKAFSAVCTFLAKKARGGEGKWRKQSITVGFGVYFWERMLGRLDFFFFLSETSESEGTLLGTVLFPEIYSLFLLVINALADSIEWCVGRSWVAVVGMHVCWLHDKLKNASHDNKVLNLFLRQNCCSVWLWLNCIFFCLLSDRHNFTGNQDTVSFCTWRCRTKSRKFIC